MEDNKRISIKFEHIDENGYFYSAESKFDIIDGFGNTLDELGRAFNAFLKQVGYAFNNDCILMQSLNEEECFILNEWLAEFRKLNGKGTCSD